MFFNDDLLSLKFNGTCDVNYGTVGYVMEKIQKVTQSLISVGFVRENW